MHPSTTAIITATEYGIFLQIHMLRFFMDLCVHWIAIPWILLFCIFGDFYASGMQYMQRLKSLHIFFFCMEKRLLEDFVVKCNQWKHWMSFIACACRFSRSYTVYSWLSKGWLLGIGHTKQCNDFPEWPPNNSLLHVAQFPVPKVRSWLFTCN